MAKRWVVRCDSWQSNPYRNRGAAEALRASIDHRGECSLEHVVDEVDVKSR